MKIALVHYSAPPVIGGVERVVGEQIQLLQANGHHVSLASFEGGESPRPDCFIPLSREATSTDLETYLCAALCGMDIVLMHNVGTMPFHPELTLALRSLSKNLRSTRWVCWIHDIAAGNPDYLPFSDPEYRALMESACPSWEYVAISETRAKQARELFGISCTVIPNGIDLAATLNICPKVAAFAEANGLWDSDITLIHPARIVPRKSIETGMELTAALTRTGRNVHYLLTGPFDPHNLESATLKTALKKKCKELQIDHRFHFCSDLFPIEIKELTGLYTIADALFFPSKQEGFGLPILEATAHKIPAICPDRAPMNNLPGSVPFDPKLTPSELAEWVIQLLESRESITARKSLCQTYRWQAVYRNFLAPFLGYPQT